MSDQPFLAIFGVAITEAADLIYAAASAMHGEEFVRPPLEQRCCCCCGAEAGWVSFQTLQLDGHAAGFAYLFHCQDCLPESLLPNIKAVGTWPMKTDEWKFSQGDVP